jgi:GLPGLI family protein
MKKIIFIAFYFLSISFIQAQHDSISGSVYYNYEISQSQYTGNYKTNSKLIFNTNESLYEIDHLNSFYSDEDSNNNIGVKSEENEFVYKNTKNNTMYYTDLIRFTHFHIKDTLNIMNWNLNENTKDILGYHCQEATTNYGGRFYIAYYTTEIPISNGPWRFNGLPGLILEVHSIDKVFNLVATSLKIKNEKVEIKNPFESKKSMSWQEFLDFYQKKHDDLLRNNMTEYGPEQGLPKKGIVEYIKD